MKMKPYYMQASLTGLMMKNPANYRIIWLFERTRNADQKSVKCIISTKRTDFVRRVVITKDEAAVLWKKLLKKYGSDNAKKHAWGASLYIERPIRKRLAYQLENAVMLAGFSHGQYSADVAEYAWEAANSGKPL